MKAFHTLTCNYSPGMFGDLAAEAIHLAKITGCIVEFDFNGVMVKVDSESSPQNLYDDHQRELRKSNK